jgi:hypothetical protein
MSLTGKQKLYEYSPEQGGRWWLKPTPECPDWFEKELGLLGGYSDRGQPNLRVVWGGTVLHDITEKPQLKYKVTREIITGYNYKKQDGTIGSTPSMNLPDDALVPWEFHPKKERLELGRLRWAIERHVPAHELDRLGRFRNRRSPDGELVLRELPPEGIYEHFFWVQTADHKYRDLDRQVLTAVEAMYRYNLTTSEAQKALDAIEREQNKTIIGAHEARSIWNTL